MKRQGTRHKVFFGWWTVLATGILSGLGHGIHTQGASVIFKPVCADLQISRATMSTVAGIGRIEGGIEAPITGWLVDKFGPKWVMFTGVCLMGVGLILMKFVNSFLAYCLVWAVAVGTGTNVGLSIAVDNTLTNWFIHKRGLAMSIKFGLLSVGGVVALPLIAWLVAGHGWRTACFVGGITMLIASPLVLLFVKQKRPEYYGLLPDGVISESDDSNVDVDAMLAKGAEYAASVHETEFTLKQAMKTRSYWLLILSQVFWVLLSGTINLHTIPFLTDRGIDPIVAANMMALQVFFNVPSRFVGGFLADRVRTDRLQYALAASSMLSAIGMAVFLLKQTVPMIYVFLILYGMGLGAATVLRIAMLGRYFGRKSYGTVQGTSSVFTMPLSFCAPIYAGWAYDTSGSYISVFTQAVILAMIGTLITCLIRPPKPLAQISGIRQFR